MRLKYVRLDTWVTCSCLKWIHSTKEAENIAWLIIKFSAIKKKQREKRTDEGYNLIKTGLSKLMEYFA